VPRHEVPATKYQGLIAPAGLHISMKLQIMPIQILIDHIVLEQVIKLRLLHIINPHVRCLAKTRIMD
jgi:hypothetical protein